MSRSVILEHAVRLAQREPISELSMVRLARELGVTPGLVHYYVGSRDELISAIMNRAFKERLEALPPPTGNWRADLEALAKASHRMMERWKGVATYVVSHNRFRLFQKVLPGERDYGLAFFDHVARILRDGGFSAAQAAMAYHLLMLFLIGVANAEANRQAPAEHREFILGYLSQAPSQTHPGAAFIAEPFTRIDTAATLESGLRLLLDGFAGWLIRPEPDAAPASRLSRGS